MAKTIKKATQTKAPAKNTSVETAMKAVAAKKPEVKAEHRHLLRRQRKSLLLRQKLSRL